MSEQKTTPRKIDRVSSYYNFLVVEFKLEIRRTKVINLKSYDLEDSFFFILRAEDHVYNFNKTRIDELCHVLLLLKNTHPLRLINKPRLNHLYIH